MYTDKLYHHGIKGQKWGVRRFQNQNGRLTAAGKKRYADDSNSQTTKSKHRQKLQAKYRAQGMDQYNAEIEASRQIRTEKIIAAAAGLTVAACATYVIAKNIQYKSDHIIKSGTSFQRIADSHTVNTDHAFFTTPNKRDKVKYAGMYGKQLKAGGAKNIHKIVLNADSDVKVVSQKKASEVFTKLYKSDPEFRKQFKESNELFLGGGRKANLIANGKMTDKQLKKYGYEAFNIGLVNHDNNGSAVAQKFYDKLKSMGYDAVDDINDRKYSGYNTKQPVIVFNSAKKMSVSSATKMADAEINKYAAKAAGMIYTPQLAKAGALYVAAPAIASKSVKSIQNTRFIRAYKSENPNTRLSDKEILELMEG